MSHAAPPRSPIGTRIAIIGNTSAGKSTLAARLARALDAPFVELDALNFEPGWRALAEHDPHEFVRRVREATQGDAWVVAGGYQSLTQDLYWDRLHTVIWLDPPLRRVLPRVLTRSWRRWRSKELLWGTNYERFWPQLRFWGPDSLLWYAVTTQRRKHDATIAAMADPRWSHIRFLRLTSFAEVDAFVAGVERSVAPRAAAPTTEEAR
ncbi:MAG: hypothetical protein WD800_06655 [Dehalococcoidia bacterium]